MTDKNIIINKIVSFIAENSPNETCQFKLTCGYYDDAMQIETFYLHENIWVNFDCGDFELMDLCEELIDATYNTCEAGWTEFLLEIKEQSNSHRFGFNDPKIFEFE